MGEEIYVIQSLPGDSETTTRLQVVPASHRHSTLRRGLLQGGNFPAPSSYSDAIATMDCGEGEAPPAIRCPVCFCSAGGSGWLK